MLAKIFKLKAKNATAGTEILAGLVTFMTMAYIIFVNPDLLSKAGVPFEAALMATVLSAALTTILMGLFTNLPFALAAGMGYNVFFAFTVCGTMHIPWQVGLGCVFWNGVIFVVLALLPWREAIIKTIPLNLKLAASCGIGIFIAFIGLSNAGMIVADPSVKVALGNVRSPAVLLTIFGLLLTAVFMARKIKGALLWGIVVITFAGMFIRLPQGGTITKVPSVFGDILQLPSWNIFAATFLQMDILGAFRWSLLPVIFTFVFFDIFDTIGSVSGLAAKLNILDERGSFPQAARVLLVDAGGTMIGALLGTTTVTTYIESAAGITEGGKTGLTALTVGILFLLGSFFAPFAGLVPSCATAPALVLVGLFMMEPILRIEWKDVTEALPAFLTIILMPLTCNIAHGLAFGIISYTVLKLITGRGREASPLMYGLAGLFIFYYLLGKVG